MERTPNCCTAASLVVVIMLMSLPVKSWCIEETYKSLSETKPDCLGEDTALKRFDDIDYDSFVGLMGKKRAAPTNGKTNSQLPARRHTDRVLELLGWRTRMACPCAERYFQKRGVRFLEHGKRKIQHSL